MGVALENARLFDETQRLLKETEQRAAELAIINSVSRAWRAKLDFQAIVDLVGDKLREVFARGDIEHPPGMTTAASLMSLSLQLRARPATAVATAAAEARRRLSRRWSQRASRRGQHRRD